ncbi:MAG TPA: 5'-methylthioadenosine/S-adenosylhomocysteine nucleosidase [Saprospiraceae bacterium]|nr:5'-methylthioadenosine/S-adenosylhomocysteine nucleosidase [Saprospiraceae bacterium]HMQ81902.1 5'-methylthioadenosine/S-adenosylhomocysteine nucleosidase [Saprospiraceae bacterium]
MRIALLTPIEIEYKAVRSFLESVREVQEEGLYYTMGQFQGLHHTFSIVLRQTGSRNSEVALATERVIRLFQPEIAILTGIAGGVKDASIGDVVVGTQAYGYEAGKSTDAGFSSRPNVLPYSWELIELAQHVAQEDKWRQRLADAAKPKVFFGAIASGDQVVASTRSEAYQIIKAHYNDTLALEMEAIGFARAATHHRQVRIINIRGVSDLLDGKNAAHDAANQPMAAHHAAAFVFELLQQLNFQSFTNQTMDTKVLAKQIVNTLFPLLKLDSLQQIGQEFKQATDGTILEIWEKVKPIFIEEVDAEEEVDTSKGAVSSSLRKKLEQDAPLKTELEALLKVAETKGTTPVNQVTIVGSKNVVQGSTISVGGDFRVGDG